jgi:hypothetical protein
MNLTLAFLMLLAGAEAASLQPKGIPPRDTRVFLGLVAFREAVVYGDVVSVTDRDGRADYPITLKVRCTLAGPYDAARFPFPEVVLAYRYGLGVRPPSPPKVNAHVVVRMIYSDRWFIPYSPPPAPYMPGGKPIVEVTGFDDPKVTDIISSLRKTLEAEPLERWQAAILAMEAEEASDPNLRERDWRDLDDEVFRILASDLIRPAPTAKPSPQGKDRK